MSLLTAATNGAARLALVLSFCVVAVAGGGAAHAQVVPANVAVPFYIPPAFLRGIHAFWYTPRAREFSEAASALVGAVDQVCAGGNTLDQARTRWQSTAVAWDRLAAVAIGPLLQRRSMRQIDFTPTRPELIARAIQAQPADAKALERIGTPAKGIPALEWLLWTQPIAAAGPSCRYAQLVATEVAFEARALQQGFAELATKDWATDEEAATAAMAELLNQWVGGIERLRWASIEKPLRSAGGKPPAFPRSASGSSRQSWMAQWEGLRALGTALDNQIPEPGAALVPLETYLRGRGLNPLANKLAGAAAQSSRLMAAATPGDGGKTLAATRSLTQLKRLAEAEVAPALEVNIGFSDADGD